MKPNKQTNIHQQTEYINLFCTNAEQFRSIDNYMFLTYPFTKEGEESSTNAEQFRSIDNYTFLTYPFTKEGEESSAGDLVPTFLDSYTQ